MAGKLEAETIVQIDQDHLDRECIELPSQYLRYAFLAAEAKRDVDESKADMDVVQAELASEVRSTPAKFGIEKLTESAVSATILTLAGYKKALAEYQKAKHHYEMTQAVVWALEHKKRSLTLLVELHGLGYFSNVKMSAEGKDAVQKMTRRRSVRAKEEE